MSGKPPPIHAVLFIGVQASGKSSFFHEQFSHSHVRINLDMLKTRRRERVLLQTCIEIGQALVIDNTNPTRADRARYISELREAGCRIDGYYFRSSIEECMERNARRRGDQRVPDTAVLGTHAKLELPSYEEGFDGLFYVQIDDPSGFRVEEWQQ